MWTLFDRLLSNSDGMAPAHIRSFDLDATLTRQQHERARIADVQVPGGLKTGKNIAHVTLWPYGQAVPLSLDVTFTIPKGMALQGWLDVSAPESDVYMFEDYFNDFEYWGGVPPARQTRADVVADIGELPTNEDLQLTFQPTERADSEDEVHQATASQGTGVYLQGTPASSISAAPG